MGLEHEKRKLKEYNFIRNNSNEGYFCHIWWFYKKLTLLLRMELFEYIKYSLYSSSQ